MSEYECAKLAGSREYICKPTTIGIVALLSYSFEEVIQLKRVANISLEVEAGKMVYNLYPKDILIVLEDKPIVKFILSGSRGNRLVVEKQYEVF